MERLKDLPKYMKKKASEKEQEDNQKSSKRRTKLKEPSKDELAAYKIHILFPDKTQSQIAAIMTKKTEQKWTQSRVSRVIKKARAYIEAGGLIQDSAIQGTTQTSVDILLTDEKTLEYLDGQSQLKKR